MKEYLCFIPLLCTQFMFAASEIVISQEQVAKNGIKIIPLNQAFNTKGVPFNALIDFDDKSSSTQSSSFETIVVNIYKREGESVNEGDLICDISSNELSALFFELTNTRERLKIAKENEAKDKSLYKAGVISKREYQLSYLAMNELRLKLNEIQSKLDLLGIDPQFIKNGSQGRYGFPVVAKTSGILSVAPKQSGEKIGAFTPYVRISKVSDNATSNLLGHIKIPLHLSHNIQKGSPVFDDDGNKIGEVETMSVVIDKVSNTILAIANIRDTNLKVGEMIEVYIDGLLPKGTILIPSSAVIKNGNDYFIFVQSAKGFKPTKIHKVEERDNGFVIDPKGLNAQMKIATGNIISLKGMMDGLGSE
ncbi:efflux RND transporter periplasmic adaptor subunit [Helicobacter sp. MIT 03-1616]|uniref:efflux RND transporter periplasmic adaptor subunit n=1 Tax=Helicobacter sp. MIT 03-1616 TaxID=1548148 RepID=UPI00051D5268|nr:efflux RND transporter periplasmic adaptor subunit [Helicobacter sp. MIT 03-1616]TLD89731.1 sodium:proton antiporter [Helicobacter sp. MIT 03-1616]